MTRLNCLCHKVPRFSGYTYSEKLGLECFALQSKFLGRFCPPAVFHSCLSSKNCCAIDPNPTPLQLSMNHSGAFGCSRKTCFASVPVGSELTFQRPHLFAFGQHIHDPSVRSVGGPRDFILQSFRLLCAMKNRIPYQQSHYALTK